MSWFASLRLAYKIIFILGILTFLIISAGAAIVFYNRRRRRFARAGNLREARLGVAEQARRRYQQDEGNLFGVRAMESAFYGAVIPSRSGYVVRAPPPSLLSSRTSSNAPGAPEPVHLPGPGNSVFSPAVTRSSFPLALNPYTADDFNRFQSPRKAPEPNRARPGRTDIESVSIPASPTRSDTSIASTVTSPSSPKSPKALCSHFSTEYPPTLQLSRDFRASFRSWSRSTRNIGHSASSSVATIARPVGCYSRPPSLPYPTPASAEPPPPPLQVYRGEAPSLGSSIDGQLVSRLHSKSASTPTLPTANTTEVRSSRRTSASSSFYSTNSDLATQLQSPDLSLFEQPSTLSTRLSKVYHPQDKHAIIAEAWRYSEVHNDPTSTSNANDLAPPNINNTRQTSELGELYDSYWQHGLFNTRDQETSKRRAGEWGGLEPVVVDDEGEGVGHERRITSGVPF